MRLVIDLQAAQGSSHARGIGRYSRELALAMASAPRGHEVVVVLSAAMPETAAALTASFAGILPRGQIRLWHPPSGVGALHGSKLRAFGETLRAQFLASLRPSLVHVCSLFEGLGDDVLSLQPSHLERLPVVATCYDLIPLMRPDQYFEARSPLSSGARWYYRCVQEISLSEGLLAISESSRGEAIRYLPYAPDRVFNIQAGVSADFRPANLSTEASAALLQRYGLRASFILFLGAGDLRKNEVGLIAAYAQLPRTLQEAHQLVIVGRIDQAAMRKAAAQLHVQAADFVIIPFADENDLIGLYSSCALFVFPSLHEGFGLPLAEAMACGAPSIGSNTTSLPEVLGRTDATFDPSDPADIAACMRKVLENPAFRDELAAYGRRRAGSFTWQSSASRAWEALEQIHDRLATSARPGPVGILQARPRLAFVSPLPPERSGIADYGRDLLPSLAHYYDITVVTGTAVKDIRLEAAFPRLEPAEFLRQAGSFDRVVYQIGNSQFHRFQTEELLPNVPGVVVLHDTFLSDYMNWVAHERGRPDDFRAMLLMEHGYPALRYEADHGREAAIAHFPCCLSVLSASIGVIQHSRHGIDVLAQHFGADAVRDVVLIPFFRAGRALPSRTEARRVLGLQEDEFVVCSFGMITPLKCPALLTEAWRLTGLAGRMVFAGEAAPGLKPSLIDEAAGLQVTGRLQATQYDAWLAASDVAVQWRTGSRGESSAAAADALMAGLPLIVNRHGSAAELPGDVVVGLPDRANAQNLSEAILALHADPARRTRLSAAARKYARRELAPETAAERYREAIEGAYLAAVPAAVAKRLDADAQTLGALPNGLALAARAIGRSFAQPWRAGGHPRLFIDMSELARRDHGSDIHQVVREIGRRVLEATPGGLRGVAVRAHEGQIRHTYEAPLRILGHAALELPELPVDAGIGDVLLCADVNAELSPAEFTELRRLQVTGMRLVLVVYDLLPIHHPELCPAPQCALVRDWYQRVLTIADGVACISRSVADELIAWLDEDRSWRNTPLPVGYFHLGTDIPAEPVAEVPATVQAALDSAGRRPTVLMTGTVEPRKGYGQALAAFEILWQDGIDLGLTIVGQQGWQMEDIARHLQASTVQGERLHWLSQCSDSSLSRLYRASAGLLMASKHEGFASPIIKAARAGLSVLARDLPVFREVAGDHARYFSGDSPEALAKALREWTQDAFAPSPAGIKPLSWDDGFRQLCGVVLDGNWYKIWQP